jgi:hypothetical protein
MDVRVLRPHGDDPEVIYTALRYAEKAALAVANASASALKAADTDAFSQVHCKMVVPEKKKSKKQQAADKRENDKPYPMLVLPTDENGRTKLPQMSLPGKSFPYPLMRQKFPELASGLVSGITYSVTQDYRRNRFLALVGKRGNENYRSRPVSFRGADIKVLREESEDGVDYILDLPVLSTSSEELVDSEGQPVHRVKLLLETRRLPRDKREALDEYAKGKKCPQVDLNYNKKKKRWYVKIPYEAEVRQADVDPKRIMVVYPPGVDRNDQLRFLLCEFRPSRGRPWRVDVEFRSYKQAADQCERMRKWRGQKYRQDGKDGVHQRTGSIGHGRNRALKGLEKVHRKARNTTNTFMQQRAALIVRTAIKWRCGRIELLDFAKVIEMFPERKVFGKFPYFMFQTLIAQKCEQHGIECEVLPPGDDFCERFESAMADEILVKETA